MSIQHAAIQSADCHEPKHISTAAVMDAGKVITPDHTTPGTSVIRQLDLSELTVLFTGSTLTSPTTAVQVRTAVLPTQASAAGRALVSNGTDVAFGPLTPVTETISFSGTPAPDAGHDLEEITLTGNVVFGVPTGSPADGQILVLRITQDGTGSRTATWNAIYRFTAGTPPTLSTGAGKTDYLTFRYNLAATKWDMVASALNF